MFSPEVMPKVECTRKIAISISDIWAFDRCSSYNIDGDISISKFDLFCDLNDVMNMYLWKCSHYLMILTHRKFNDDIFACFPVIAKNVISFIKEHRRPTLRLPCDVIDNVIIIKNFFGIIWDVIFISEIKSYLRSSCVQLLKIFKMVTVLELTTNFFYWKLYRKLNLPER